MLQRTDVLVAAGVLLVIEFVTDKIPYVDSAWDSVHTFVRPAIGGVIGALLAGDASTLGQAVAAVGTGGIALSSHLAKGGIRLAVNASPEPVTNVVASLTEDGAVAGVTLLAWEHPWLAASIALVLLVAGASLAVFLVSRLRRELTKLQGGPVRPPDARSP